MSPWVLAVLAALLLALPVLLGPKTPPADPWEFRGFAAFLWYLNSAYCFAYHRLATGPITLPPTGPAILIANHTCNIDHCLLQAATGRKLSFLIARKYYAVPFFRPFCDVVGCIPVDEGRFTAASRTAIRALGEGRVLAVFPEGEIHPTSGLEITEGKPGVAFIALKAKVAVIPAYIRGTPRSNVVWRSFLTPSDARVVFGPPIELPTDDPPEEGHHGDRALLGETTERFMAAIRALRDRELALDP